MSIRLDDLARLLDRSGPIPLYHQLKQWFSSRILSGELAPGEQLPDEFEMCERLGVSRGVIRQAMTELEYAGMISRQRGRGTFVAIPKTAEGLISGLRGLADDAAMRGQKIDSKVLLLREVRAEDTVAEKLELRPGDPVVELERLRRLEGEPHVVVVTYLPALLVPGLVKEDFNGGTSLYRMLRDNYGLNIVSGVRRVEVATAGARQARLLGVKRGSPLMVLRSVGFTSGHRPLDYFIAYHRGDQTAFEVELRAPVGTASRFEQVPAARGGSSW